MTKTADVNCDKTGTCYDGKFTSVSFMFLLFFTPKNTKNIIDEHKYISSLSWFAFRHQPVEIPVNMYQLFGIDNGGFTITNNKNNCLLKSKLGE